jgi:small subunit ribosomal protein S7
MKRCFADSTDTSKKTSDVTGPNMEQLPHISEEAAGTAKATGRPGPDIQQGTPIGEVSYSLSLFP